MKKDQLIGDSADGFLPACIFYERIKHTRAKIYIKYEKTPDTFEAAH